MHYTEKLCISIINHEYAINAYWYHLITSPITYNLSFPYKMILKERAIGPFCLSYIKSMTYNANHKNIDI